MWNAAATGRFWSASILVIVAGENCPMPSLPSLAIPNSYWASLAIPVRRSPRSLTA